MGALKKNRSAAIAVDYDRNADVLYIARGERVPAEGEGLAGGVELDYALADGSPCAATVIGFRRNEWSQRLEELAGIIGRHLSVGPRRIATAIRAAIARKRIQRSDATDNPMAINPMAISYIDKKDLIRSELMKLATAKPIRLLTYGEFGRRVGIPSRGPWKGILDLIAKEEKDSGRPDITFLIINSKTRYPSQIGFVDAVPPTEAQKQVARAEFRKIAARYSPGSPNPF